jgi:hypothetical protein
VSAVAEERVLFAELWLSFGSLVRAYAAAASVNAGPGPEVEAAGNTIRVTAGAARLEVRCDPETGAGNWRLNCGAQGLLQILHEGRVALDGETLDLDHAAIDLIALVMNAATNPAREEP